MRPLVLGLVLALCAPAPAMGRERERTAKEVFRDCRDCPDMVAIPGGEFLTYEVDGSNQRRPRVSDFAIGRTEVTFDQWAACVKGGGCASNPNPDDSGWGRGARPVINISYEDALEYTAWLSRKTRARYRLPTDDEWEYGGQTPSGVWRENSALGVGRLAESAWSYEERARNAGTSPVGAFAPNWFGLYDYLGNVGELVADGPAPSDHVRRGSDWEDTYSGGGDLIHFPRSDDPFDQRTNRTGFRVARDLARVRTPEPIRMPYTGPETPPLERGFYIVNERMTDAPWTSARPVPLYAAPGAAEVVATAAAGEQLRRVAEQVLVRALRGMVARSFGPYEAGALIWLLGPESEGYGQVWYRGEIAWLEEPTIEPLFRWDEKADGQSLRSGCWTQLQRRDGTRGWSNDAALGCGKSEGEQTSEDE